MSNSISSGMDKRYVERGEPSSRQAGAVRYRTWRLAGRLAIYLILAVGGFVMLLPFLWMVSTAVKPEVQVFQFPPKWIPDPVLWSNFVEVATRRPQYETQTQYVGMEFGRYLVNTSTIVVLNIIGSLVSCSLAAYGFARLRSRYRNFLFILVLSTMMMPWQVMLIPQFILFKTLGWTDSILPLTVPAFFGNAFFIFLLRQFFMVIPRELDDAARIDGCHSLQIYYRILLPLCKQALVTVAIFTFMYHWNDFMGPLIYLDNPDKFTLALGLRQFVGMYGPRYNYLMAASTLVMLPCLVIFFTLQKYFIQGVVMYSFKG